MDIAVAIATINGSELGQKAEVVAAIEALRTELSTAKAQVDGLTEERSKLAENNAGLLAQKANANARLKDLEKKISELTAVIATDGEDQDATLERLKGLGEELQQAKADLANAQQREAEAIAAKAGLEQQLVYRDAGAKLGVETVVFEKLLELPGDRIIIDDDGVKVRGEGDDAKLVPFDDYLATQTEAVQRMVKLAMGGTDSNGQPVSGTAPNGRKPGPSAPPTSGKPKPSATEAVEALGFKGPAFQRKG
ncbi:MAG: hypothetical protein ACHWZW_02880 [Spirulina sp.]